MDAERARGSVLEAAQDAVVAVDALGRVVVWNRAAERTFGWTRNAALGRPVVELLVPPGLRDQAQGALARLVRGEGREVAGRRVEVVACRQDGAELPVELSLGITGDGEDTVVHAFCRDLRPRQSAADAAGQLLAVLESTGDAVAVLDERGALVRWNPAAEQLFGWTAVEVRGEALDVVVPERRRPETWALLRDARQAGEPRRMETTWRNRDGEEVELAITVTPLRDARAHTTGHVVVGRDVAERRRALEELERRLGAAGDAGGRDAITHLLTLPAFEEAQDRILGRLDPRAAAAFVVLDLDGLRHINAEHGFRVGDEVLRLVARALRRHAPAGAPCARPGADDFAVLLAGAGRAQAEALARAVQSEVADSDLRVRVSYGIATRPDDGTTKEALRSQAELALLAGRRGAASARRFSEALRTVAARADAASPAGREGPLPPVVRNLIERVLYLVRHELGLEVAFLGELERDVETFRALDGDGTSFGLRVGAAIPREGSYCERMVAGGVGQVVPDAAVDPALASLEITTSGGVRAYVGVPVRLPDGSLYGALCGLSHEPRPDLVSRDLGFLAVLASLIGEHLDQRAALTEQARADRQATAAQALIAALDARDSYTGAHSEAVVRLSRLVARELRLGEDEVALVERAARLHDIGKIGVPDAVLRKPDTLSEEEWSLMRAHPVIGAQIVGAIRGLEHLAPVLAADHERWDGAGYPHGLAGEDIPLGARIIFACDAYDAMVTDRPYRSALSDRAARAELRRAAGSQFDPLVVGALLDVLSRADAARRMRAPAA